MPKGNHGDRPIAPRPINELLGEVGLHDVEPEQEAPSDQLVFDDWQPPQEPVVQRELPHAETLDPDAPVRLQSAAIAGASFGAAGCYDTDLLLRRAEAIANYIKNGLE